MNSGQLIADRYLIVAELASGGMGITYRAWDKVLSRPVVIKMPKQECLRDPVHLARFRREIDLMNTHPHSSIVPVIGNGEFDGQAYIAMRFLPGGSLADRQRGGQYGDQRQKPAEALHLWLPAIATALDFLHEKQVVHRDIKPSNIFFDSYFNAFLGDFGLAKGGDFGTQELTETNAGLGTLAYTPPEQLQRSKTVDSRADQYALAVSVFEYLAGRKPFVGEKKHVVLEVLQDDPPRLSSVVSGVPESLCFAVQQAMSRSPADRFESCTAFVASACRDIPVPSLTRDVARMLCPACKRIIKLRPSVAGQTGRCPKCQAPMTAAADLSAFWLVSEDPTQRVASVLSELPEASRLDDSSSGQRGPLFERDDFSQILSAVDCESPELSPQQGSSTADATERKSSSGVLEKTVFTASSLPLMRVIWLLVLVVGAALVLCGYLVGSLQSQMFVRVKVNGNTKASVFNNEQTGLLRYLGQEQNDPVEIKFVPAAGLYPETDGIGSGSGRLFGQLEVEVQGYGCECRAEVYRGEELVDEGKVDGEVNGHDIFRASVRMVGEESVRLVITFVKANENVLGLKGCFYSYRLIPKDSNQE